IINTVYENVNTLMAAEIFGIGLLRPDDQTLVFPATKEKGATLPEFAVPLDDENRLAVWCFKNRHEVMINDYGQEYIKYIQFIKPAAAGENPESILYLPLVHKDKPIGVITAQSFGKNAYTDYHLNMLRNLATYSAIALENADAYRRVNELLADLKATQDKLVTQSKLAALGALTAGIAHEIKNPLNFVNNFSELSKELIQELEETMANEPADRTAIGEILATLKQNADKINEHGRRADNIVRSMLQHSRGKSGERQLTDVNAMLVEDINLAYHGMRAQDSNFNIKIETELDPRVGRLDIVPQDISRVFLNIISNACYAAHHKKLIVNGDFASLLTVKTIGNADTVEIRIRDNGDGIPDAIRDKLFTPFFTTKPTGQGTGLGLSISYDVVVHEHNGQLFFESHDGEYAEFIIKLPRSSKS
ncbi:MAG: serine/threonine-protein kinase PknK, partial [Calditrichaeota bacterium]